jgi:hypothetical protein
MPELGEIRSSPTPATAPGANELTPPPLLVNASEASPQASLNAVTNMAEQKNMMNNIKVGGGTKRRRLHRRRRTCTCRRKKCRCMSRGRGSRSRRRKSKGHRFTASQRQVIKRRVELNLLHRKIRKNKNNQNRTRSQRQAQYGGNVSNLPLATTPQHGESCGPDQHNCPGNSSTLLLEVHRQSIVNAQGDTPS